MLTTAIAVNILWGLKSNYNRTEIMMSKEARKNKKA